MSLLKGVLRDIITAHAKRLSTFVPGSVVKSISMLRTSENNWDLMNSDGYFWTEDLKRAMILLATTGGSDPELNCWKIADKIVKLTSFGKENSWQIEKRRQLKPKTMYGLVVF